MLNKRYHVGFLVLYLSTVAAWWDSSEEILNTIVINQRKDAETHADNWFFIKTVVIIALILFVLVLGYVGVRHLLKASRASVLPPQQPPHLFRDWASQRLSQLRQSFRSTRN